MWHLLERKKRVDRSIHDTTSFESFDNTSAAFSYMTELVMPFERSRWLLQSDCNIMEGEALKNVPWALLASENVLAMLKQCLKCRDEEAAQSTVPVEERVSIRQQMGTRAECRENERQEVTKWSQLNKERLRIMGKRLTLLKSTCDDSRMRQRAAMNDRSSTLGGP